MKTKGVRHEWHTAEALGTYFEFHRGYFLYEVLATLWILSRLVFLLETVSYGCCT